MKLNLTKPLVIFDLETTGLDIVKARIIQLSYIKVHPDGREERGDMLLNPEEHIPQFVTDLTGISDEDVKDKPTFKQVAANLATLFGGSDFGGFNSNGYDIPLLAEEFLRAGIDFDFSKTATERVACEYNGKAMSIGFKGSAFIDILSNFESPEVIIQLADPSRAGLVLPSEQPENQDVLMLMMPMLIND